MSIQQSKLTSKTNRSPIKTETSNSKESKSPHDSTHVGLKSLKGETGKSLDKSIAYPEANTKKEISPKTKPSNSKTTKAKLKKNSIWSNNSDSSVRRPLS